MKLDEALNLFALDEAVKFETLKNYLMNAKQMIEKGSIDKALVTLSGMAHSAQQISGDFESAEQGQLKSMANQLKATLEQNKSKIPDKKKYSESIQSLNTIVKALEDSQANVVKNQQLTRQKLAPSAVKSTDQSVSGTTSPGRRGL